MERQSTEERRQAREMKCPRGVGKVKLIKGRNLSKREGRDEVGEP